MKGIDKLFKTELPKIVKSWGIFARRLGLLMNVGLPLIKDVLQALGKSLLIPLGLPAAATDSQVFTKDYLFGMP